MAAAFGASRRRSTSATKPAFSVTNVLGTDFRLDVHLHRGAGAYICGEETGLIESLEGKRAWPRIKPPFPAVEGLFRKPTIVNNVETLCCVTHIFRPRRGMVSLHRRASPIPTIRATSGSFGPKLYCVSGHVNKPGCFELPLGVTSRELIEEHCGGVWKGRKVKAVIPGGISTGFLSANEFDVPLDFSGPAKRVAWVWARPVVVIDDQTNMVDVLYNCCRFFAHESCGQCTPCREGTDWMRKILERIWRAMAPMRDIDLLQEIAGSMGIIPGTTICGLADGAAWPVKNAITKFRQRFRRLSKAAAASNGRCGGALVAWRVSVGVSLQ